MPAAAMLLVPWGEEQNKHFPSAQCKEIEIVYNCTTESNTFLWVAYLQKTIGPTFTLIIHIFSPILLAVLFSSL